MILVQMSFNRIYSTSRQLLSYVVCLESNIFLLSLAHGT